MLCDYKKGNPIAGYLSGQKLSLINNASVHFRSLTTFPFSRICIAEETLVDEFLCFGHDMKTKTS